MLYQIGDIRQGQSFSAKYGCELLSEVPSSAQGKRLLKETFDNQAHQNISGSITGNAIDGGDISQLESRQHNVDLNTRSGAKTSRVISRTWKHNACRIKKQ